MFAAEGTFLQDIIDGRVFALPSFARQGGPFAAGLGRVTPAMPASPKSRAALAVLYSALMTDVCLDLIGASGELVVEGSLANNAAYLGVLAALRPDQPVQVSTDATGTVSGTALLTDWPNPIRQPMGNDVGCEPLTMVGLEDYRYEWLGRLA